MRTKSERDDALKRNDGSPNIPINSLRNGWIATNPAAAEAASRVVSSGHYIHGPEHAAFEQELAGFVGTEHAIGVASGTDALVLALCAVGVTRGSEVITAPNAGGYTSNACDQIGASVAYADIDPASHLITAEALAKAIGPDTDAVVVTHLYGNVVDVSAIRRHCDSLGIPVVEDCAQALGAFLGDARVGSIGAAAAVSFYPTKNLGAAGDAGAVLTNDPAVAERVKSLRQYGWDEKFAVSQPGGRNSRLDEIQAAILRVGLPLLDDFNERRRVICDRYRQVCEGTELRLVTGANVPTVGHHAVVETTTNQRRDGLRHWLTTRGIGTDIHYPILDFDQPGLPRPSRSTATPNSTSAVGRILTIPCYPGLTNNDLEWICTSLDEFAKAQS